MSLPEQDRWRAPVGDWPPAWASAWGSDRFGLWADLTIGAATQRMRWIEPSGPEGFAMGEGDARRQVAVEAGFWLADTPCTQAFWVAVSSSTFESDPAINPSMFQQGEEAAQLPVEQVSWDDVLAWLVKLVHQNPTTVGLVELPTEVQWEYAARAGTRTAYWWGDEFDESKANTNVDGDRDLKGSKGATTPVKRYPPNPWGLYDVHGNVWEWCDDAWRDRLDGEGGEADPSRRAVRGGSWLGGPGRARSAYRFRWLRGRANRYLGFRLSLRSPAPGPQAPGAR
ncbi:MAG: formylglycine-generating enzyme family protein [Burkholderiales bacterium]|nr:formylglycine-generating enzyme family protein [Burkholderiales bacterium]